MVLSAPGCGLPAVVCDSLLDKHLVMRSMDIIRSSRSSSLLLVDALDGRFRFHGTTLVAGGNRRGCSAMRASQLFFDCKYRRFHVTAPSSQGNERLPVQQ